MAHNNVSLIEGELSPNFTFLFIILLILLTFWDESARGWSTYWKVVTQNISEIGGGEPV